LNWCKPKIEKIEKNLLPIPNYGVSLAEKIIPAVDLSEAARRSILNVARMGRFSSDRTVREYAEGIWGIEVE
jgi:starch phosphorylase